MDISDVESNTLCHAISRITSSWCLSQVHPRAKVREQEQNNHLSLQNDSPSMALLKVLESLSSYAKETRKNAPSPSSKIPKSGVKNLAAVTSKGIRKNDKHTGEDEKQTSRACSVPRPRAVLSSPDNDGMIGNQNKLITRSRSIPREHGLKQNSHVQVKEIPIHGKAESPPSMRKREVSNTNNSRLKQRNSGEPLHLGQKSCPRKVGKSVRV